MEKRWIIFQLLKVLEECDKRKINHGDIKSENVLLTGWSWVMLTDFASFKPTLLPDVSDGGGGEGGGRRSERGGREGGEKKKGGREEGGRKEGAREGGGRKEGGRKTQT